MPRPTSWRGALDRAVHHPRSALALKTGVAASLAWLAALQLPGPASEYAFYAPLGAVVASYPTVASTVRQSLQAVASISIGAALALVTDRYLGATPALVAVVVGLGVLVAGLPWLGEMRTYVPTSALFVLVIGQGEEVAYSASFAGLFLLGAAIAMLANLLFPALPLRPADQSLGALRRELHDHLDHLARTFEGDRPVDDPAGPGRSGLTALTARARAAVIGARDSVRGNRRARRDPEAVALRWDAFRALERVVLLVDDLYDLAEEAPWGTDLRSSAETIRIPLARALDELDRIVARVGTGQPVADSSAAAEAAVADLSQALVEHHDTGGSQAESLVVATITTSLRRCVAVVTSAAGTRTPDAGGVGAS